MYQLEPMFAVPLAHARVPDCERLNSELRDLFLARAGEGDKYRNPDPFVQRNDTLFESNFRLFDWPQPCIEQLRCHCWRTLYRLVGDLNGYDMETLKRLHVASESWFHLARKGAYFGPHNHPMHSWSGVYCVSHDDDDPEGGSGRLTMINPHATSTMYVDMASFRMKPPYSMAHRPLRLVPGDLVLFPSWLLHHVTPYEGPGVRITVAFNARFRLEGAEPADVPLG